MTATDIVQKLWNLCDVLRDDGINYSDYVTELVLLLFLKMEHENRDAGVMNHHPLPEGCRWPDIASKSGISLMTHYRQTLLDLSKSDDPLIAAIYADAQTRMREPRHLEQLIRALDQIDWFSAREDGLGDLYEGLLEKNASETKSGAGQYFTPRPLINCMVRCMNPRPGEIVQDPAAGTAGFLIAADRHIKDATEELFLLTLEQQEYQRRRAFTGIELVPGTRRLALMNCLLHNMEGDAEGVVHLGNALGQAGASLPKADLILANPPFGTSKGGEASITRDDLTFRTSNKQLAFLQHIYRGLKPGGRAAVVLPDNVLFEAGAGTDIRRDLMEKCTLHTLLRLPTGIFYAHGVKTNVLFFTRGTEENPRQEEGCTKKVWVYDLRTNMPAFGKRTPFGETQLAPFETVYAMQPRREGEWSFGAKEAEATENGINEGVDQDLRTSRWRSFDREWIREKKGDSLDITWLKDSDSVDAENLPDPEVLAAEAMAELTEALRELDGLMEALGKGDEAAVQKKLLAEVLGMGGV
ncbi:type I restriction enzyme M protein [Desulfobotulus alkaliphilus]|uniref:site-specific DNA-methyltransferase (adenine-specific) n=1 Tax=Desulfobotulus alkaliphilus TaxID=622671 RepID=A0A562S7E7_9BACT|nr:N-6 DNA methylase [Desulfobotulus alkaliphilus]TWI77339.1 type I restriction enzyme M protein [Desulfobotulus alkaliphilus]